MIITSSYNNWQSDKYVTYSISGNKGKDVNYVGKYYSKLAPKYNFWKIWHDNIGKVSEEENNKYYVEQYWKQVLSKLDPEEVYQELNNSVLLCYEENTEFCHRHIVAFWFEILLDVTVSEQKANEYLVEELERPSYIKEYLEEIMRKNQNMRGFNSLRALHLFEKSEKLENTSEEKDDLDNYKQQAYFLLCESNRVEEEYNMKCLKKIKR